MSEKAPSSKPEKAVGPYVSWGRMKRKGNGYIALELLVPKALIDNGTIVIQEINDWDMYVNVERRLVDTCTKTMRAEDAL